MDVIIISGKHEGRRGKLVGVEKTNHGALLVVWFGTDECERFTAKEIKEIQGGNWIVQIDKKYIVYAVLVCFIICGVWYVFSSHRTASDNVDARLSAAEEQLSKLEADQRETRSAVDAAKGTADEITSTTESIDRGLGEAAETARDGAAASEAAERAMRDAGRTTDACAALVADNRTRLAECESIFQRVERSNQIRTSSSEEKNITP